MTDKLRKLADAMYYAAQYLTTDASRLHKAMDEYHQFIIHEYHKEEPTIPDIVDEHFWEMLGEEPVSDDLEEAAIQFATDTETGKVDVVKQSSFFWGAIYHKQQMMKEAVEVPIEEAVPFGSCKWKLCAKLWLDKGVKGNKVKLIIIKEGKQ